MDAKELEINIKNTKRFIDERPISLVLTPMTKQRKVGGGSEDIIGPPRPAQTFRIIENAMTSQDEHTQQSQGPVRREPYWLLGMPDAEVAQDDFWYASEGRRWRVAEVIRDNDYELRAVVEEVGR